MDRVCRRTVRREHAAQDAISAIQKHKKPHHPSSLQPRECNPLEHEFWNLLFHYSHNLIFGDAKE